jgi:hypothetical protein
MDCEGGGGGMCGNSTSTLDSMKTMDTINITGSGDSTFVSGGGSQYDQPYFQVDSQSSAPAPDSQEPRTADPEWLAMTFPQASSAGATTATLLFSPLRLVLRRWSTEENPLSDPVAGHLELGSSSFSSVQDGLPSQPLQPSKNALPEPPLEGTRAVPTPPGQQPSPLETSGRLKFTRHSVPERFAFSNRTKSPRLARNGCWHIREDSLIWRTNCVRV